MLAEPERLKVKLHTDTPQDGLSTGNCNVIGADELHLETSTRQDNVPNLRYTNHAQVPRSDQHDESATSTMH